MHFDRISHDPGVMGGKPCIRGLRVTAGMILGLLATGQSRERVLEAYPYLEGEDIDAALAYCGLALGGTRRATGRGMTIKVLVDMNLSPEWVSTLTDEGWEAVHWSAVGDPRARDTEIMAWALVHGHVVGPGFQPSPLSSITRTATLGVHH